MGGENKMEGWIFVFTHKFTIEDPVVQFYGVKDSKYELDGVEKFCFFQVISLI